VIERPRGGHRFFKTQNFGLMVKTWLKVETGQGQLGGSVEPSKGKGGESAVVILRFSMWYPPPVSVKDRGVGTRV
jgi:hypothetical protein